MTREPSATDIGERPITSTPPETRAYEPTLRMPGILIVDKEFGVRRVLGVGMRQYGFAVWLAGDGAEAVDVCRQYGNAIDLALIEVSIPGRDGPEILADLRTVKPRLRACFMAGSAGRYTVEQLLDTGALAVFRKPFALRDLAAQLVDMVKSR